MAIWQYRCCTSVLPQYHFLTFLMPFWPHLCSTPVITKAPKPMPPYSTPTPLPIPALLVHWFTHLPPSHAAQNYPKYIQLGIIMGSADSCEVLTHLFMCLGLEYNWSHFVDLGFLSFLVPILQKNIVIHHIFVYFLLFYFFPLVVPIYLGIFSTKFSHTMF